MYRRTDYNTDMLGLINTDILTAITHILDISDNPNKIAFAVTKRKFFNYLFI